ncbi:hypothetical protein, partial [Escherichia coli]|uniref:hypothetical protein n=1 Tax=Escherichia coli TaxID=562 RepID=UPI001BDCF199
RRAPINNMLSVNVISHYGEVYRTPNRKLPMLGSRVRIPSPAPIQELIELQELAQAGFLRFGIVFGNRGLS